MEDKYKNMKPLIDGKQTCLESSSKNSADPLPKRTLSVWKSTKTYVNNALFLQNLNILDLRCLTLWFEGVEQLVCHTRMTQPLGHSID